MSSQAKMQKGRLILVSLVIVLFFLAIEANLFYRQIVQHEMFDTIAEEQYLRKFPLRAMRGAIYDRNQNKMVSNTLKYDIAADPEVVQNKEKVAKACSKAFHKSKSHYLKKLNHDGRHTFLARKVDDRDIREILALRDPGLIRTKNFRREYPYQSYGAHLLGFTDTDDKGLSGLELQYEEELRGVDGEAILQRGGKQVFFNADNPIEQPVNGSDIFLTIDKNIQTIIEQELTRGVKKSKAKAGMAVVLDPFSGAVLAIANYPSFDPNRQQNYKSSVKRNRVITDVFEPGSTLKLITAAALLQERLQKEDDIVYCEQGRYKVYDRYFSDTKKHGWLTFRKTISLSSNIGMIKLSESLSSNTQFRYLRNFGFGTETGIGLRGENGGILENPQKWSGLSKASLSIGYGIGVTALQLTSAYAALINGGYLYRPYVVDYLKNESGKIYHNTEPHLVRQIISAEVSALLKDFMNTAVEEGTGKKAQLDGIKVGGKTGTARKMDPRTKQYSTKAYMASFIGFAPYDSPQFVLSIFLDEPKTSFYGGQVAAPVFKNIAQRIIHLEEGNPSESSDELLFVDILKNLPPLQGFKIENAQALLEARDLDYKIKSDGPFVRHVSTKDGTVILECGTLRLGQEKVPELIGLTLREAIQKVDLSRFRIELKGRASGIVRKQAPPPGRIIHQRTALTLDCR